MSWEEIGKKARGRLEESIPPEWRIPSDKLPPPEQLDITNFPISSGLFSESEITITTSSATTIVRHVAAGEWKAESVTRAFCRRAAVAHQLVCEVNYRPHEIVLS